MKYSGLGKMGGVPAHIRNLWRNLHRQVAQPPVYQGGWEIQGLQILKFICALLVIELHAGTADCQSILRLLCRIAVPVFFMISGYFLPNAQGSITLTRLERTFWKILRLTLWANAVYFVYYLLGKIAVYGTLPDSLYHIKFWALWFFAGVTSIGGHLWYLTAYLQVVLLLWVVVKIWRRIPRWLFMLVPVCLLTGMLLGRYSFLTGGWLSHFVLARNSIMTGLPCVLIGVLLRRSEGWLTMTTRTLLIVVLLIGVLQYLEVELLRGYAKDGNLYLFTIPWAVAIFLLFLHFRSKQPWAIALAKWGREYSLDLYIWHVLIFSVLYNAFPKLGLTWPSDVGTPIIALLTFMFAVVLHRMQSKWQELRGKSFNGNTPTTR